MTDEIKELGDPRLASVQLHEEPGSDPLTGVTSIEPIGATETVEPIVPQPECVTCHGQGSPTVQEAVEMLQFEVESGNLNPEVEAAVAIVLAALEKHHQ